MCVYLCFSASTFLTSLLGAHTRMFRGCLVDACGRIQRPRHGPRRGRLRWLCRLVLEGLRTEGVFWEGNEHRRMGNRLRRERRPGAFRVEWNMARRSAGLHPRVIWREEQLGRDWAPRYGIVHVWRSLYELRWHERAIVDILSIEKSAPERMSPKQG